MKVEVKPCPCCGMEMTSDEYGFDHPLNNDCVLGSSSFALVYVESWNTRPGEQAAFNAGLERGAEEIAEQCRIIGAGGEREAALLAKVAELEAQLRRLSGNA